MRILGEGVRGGAAWSAAMVIASMSRLRYSACPRGGVYMEIEKKDIDTERLIQRCRAMESTTSKADTGGEDGQTVHPAGGRAI